MNLFQLREKKNTYTTKTNSLNIIKKEILTHRLKDPGAAAGSYHVTDCHTVPSSVLLNITFIPK